MFLDKLTMKKVLPSPPLGGTEVFDAVDDADDTLDDDGDDDIDDDEVSLTNISSRSCVTFTYHYFVLFLFVYKIYETSLIVCCSTNTARVPSTCLKYKYYLRLILEIFLKNSFSSV